MTTNNKMKFLLRMNLQEIKQNMVICGNCKYHVEKKHTNVQSGTN